MDMKPENLNALIEEGVIVECSACGELCSHDGDLVDEQEPGSPYVVRGGWESGQIASVDGASCFDWTCGHCGSTNVDPDSPTLAEVYTHTPLNFESV